MTRPVAWQMILAGALVLLLAAVATLQYRWLGDVSQAERERMRAGLRTRTSDFTDAFDREVTRTYVAFHVDIRTLSADPARTMADAFARWQSSALAPDLVDAVYLLDGAPPAGTLRRLDASRVTLDPVEWPRPLKQWSARAALAGALSGPAAFFLSDAIDASVPAIVVSLPDVVRLAETNGPGKRLEMFNSPAMPTRAIVIVLNAERLRTGIVEPLAAKYFGAGDASEYLVTIAQRDDPSHVVYQSDPRAAPLDAPSADVTMGLFDLRMDELTRVTPDDAVAHRDVVRSNMAITIVRRSNAGNIGPGFLTGGPAQGAWQARVRYRSGPLESVVARSRRRNLAIGIGVLGLLAASFVLIIASAQRQQRLARQQIEFVAAVSHELRTPLAVIRSAGENLADGIVSGDEPVKRYGALIEGEGRRLSDMVERVMEYAGIASGHTARARADVDLSRTIGEAVDGLRAEARERDVAVIVQADAALPHVVGDPEALRSALQNIIGNAIKYSAGGATVDVRAEADAHGVRIVVVDRGIGIDAEDLPHVFKPFFRGRRASDAQIRGTGIGLSVVRHVVQTHHGRVDVRSRAGEGTTVTVDLPCLDMSAGGHASPSLRSGRVHQRAGVGTDGTAH